MSVVLAEAWRKKANDAAAVAGYVAEAPALFKPEYVEILRPTYDRATGWAHYWARQTV